MRLALLKSLIIFSADNGTVLNGKKASMLEGGSRVAYIASWPGVTPAGKVRDGIISIADVLPTFTELGGGKLPEGVKSTASATPRNFAAKKARHANEPMSSSATTGSSARPDGSSIKPTSFST